MHTAIRNCTCQHASAWIRQSSADSREKTLRGCLNLPTRGRAAKGSEGAAEEQRRSTPSHQCPLKVQKKTKTNRITYIDEFCKPIHNVTYRLWNHGGSNDEGHSCAKLKVGVLVPAVVLTCHMQNVIGIFTRKYKLNTSECASSL